MRRRVMTIAMATFFAGMMAFCDVDIIAAEENVVTEATTETAIISTTEEVTTEQNQSELKNNTTKVENKVTISKKHKKDKTSSRRKRPKSKERYKKKKIAEKNVDSKNEIIKKQKNQKEYIGDYIYFNQTDSIWNNNNLSLRSAGCGPTAVAVCISNLTHKFVSPVTVAGWAKKKDIILLPVHCIVRSLRWQVTGICNAEDSIKMKRRLKEL